MMQANFIAPDSNSGESELRNILGGIVGADNISDDPDALALHSEDIWSAAPQKARLIIAPRTLDQVSQCVAAAHAAGFAVAPRGGGMSYTGGYLPATDRTISLDMQAMDRIVAISPHDMTVTVEAGCTWTALHSALAAHGLRTPFWGAMSGLTSTIGGGISQLNAMFGAGHYGTSSESVIALTVVLGDGQIIRTGARGSDGNTPFYRHYGPDLTGLFCGDCGVFGIKAEITLRLIRNPAHEDYASFSFKTGPDLLNAMAEIARAGIASELCAFDPGLTKVRMARMSLMSDVKTLGSVIAKQKSIGKGLFAAAKIALGGRNFVEEDEFPLHVVAEGRSAAGVAADITQAREIAAQFDGVEIENTIAKVIRAMPFPPLNSILGPTGEAWVPVHGVVSLSNAAVMFGKIQDMLATLAPDFDREGITTGCLFTSMSTNALIIEPVFYWPTGWRPIHASTVEAAHLARLTPREPNPTATALVAKARKNVIEICESFGCGHFQIGRAYPYRASRDAASLAVLDAVKGIVDPANRLNPGGLGFPPDPV